MKPKPVNIAIEKVQIDERGPVSGGKQNVGDKKRQGIGVQGRDECLPFSRHGETLREKGNAVFCPCFSLILSTN